MTDTPVPPVSPRFGLPRGVVIVLGIAAGVVVLAGMRSVQSILAPTFMAVVLTICVYPLRGWLVRKGTPGWLATFLLILGIYAILIGLALAFVVGIAKFAALLPQYTAQMTQTIEHIKNGLANIGVDKSEVTAALANISPSTVLNAIGGVVSSVSGIATNLLFVIVLVLFLGVDAGVFPARLKNVPVPRTAVLAALQSFAWGTRRYFVVATVFGGIVAVLDWVALLILAIPAAGLWGLLAFVTNYIPNVGFIIGLVPPALLGLVTGGASKMVAVIVVYCVLNFVIQSVLQPKFVGDAVGLTTTMSFLSLIIWTFVLGPLGAILAIPVSLLVKAILVDADPDAKWLQLFLGDEPVHVTKDPSRPKRRIFNRRRRPPAADDDAAPAPAV